jgi:hypothetical protein
MGVGVTGRRFAGAAPRATFLAAVVVLATAVAAQAGPRVVRIREYRLPASAMRQLRADFVRQLTSRHPQHSWAPLRFNLANRDLKLMGLPSKRWLIAHRHRFGRPTAVYRGGRTVSLARRARAGSKRGRGGSGSAGSNASSPGVVTFAGAGFFGIRPGAWLLLIGKKSIGWCSAAHVYGAPGSYEISTAGHCGKPGDVATVIGAVGNNSALGATVPVLLDFGTFSVSHEAGLGNDWALIGVRPEYQSLVTPTMAFWGGPIGIYTAEGEVVPVSLTGNHPSATLNPSPNLVQQIVHYGHGAGIGAGGSPRSGSAITWTSTYFMFFGAITPGDSGSGANTLAGDAVGANRQAAGIITHIWVDPLMRQGLGIMGGTRATQVGATLANGQILPYPAPVPILP